MNKARVSMTDGPCNATLVSMPGRALTFLMAIATRAPIRALMVEGGFRAEDHAEGWRLLAAAGRLREDARTSSSQLRAQKALKEINDWLSTNARRFRAALERLHPDAVALFPELDWRYPMDVLLAAARLLERLQHGPEAADAALMATLAQRGLTTPEIQRLSQLVVEAQSAGDSAAAAPELESRTDELLELYRWYRDWAESARRFVQRRDYQIQLGIAGKRLSDA